MRVRVRVCVCACVCVCAVNSILPYEEETELEPLDLVWAKCRGYPSYPALVSPYTHTHTHTDLHTHTSTKIMDTHTHTQDRKSVV